MNSKKANIYKLEKYSIQKMNLSFPSGCASLTKRSVLVDRCSENDGPRPISTVVTREFPKNEINSFKEPNPYTSDGTFIVVQSPVTLQVSM